MKRSIKRILCAALACSLSWTLATEQVLRLFGGGASGTNAAFSATFEKVTEQFDISALREQYFNAQVQKTQSTPKYEARTVIVSLSGENAVETADGQSVSAYLRTFTGQKTIAKIEDEQDAFLRELTKKGVSYQLERRYDTLLNAVAIKVNTEYVSTIKQMAGVESAVITTTYSQPETVKSSDWEITNQSNVYDTGIYDTTKYTTGETDYGKGTVVAVLDTGLDYTHQAFRTMPEAPAWNEDYISKMITDNQLAAETKLGSLSASDVYVSAKVPFAYDYADDDADVYPSYSNHGTHVAGIIGGYDESGYTDKNGVRVWEDANGNGVWDNDEQAIAFRGVVPNAQLVICKVFSDDLDDEALGSAKLEDILAALEDCVTLGVDVINMSLGTSCGFTTTNDGDDEGELLNAVCGRVADAGISLVCAASNDYSAGYGGTLMSGLSSWGATHDLKLKPEITARGGEITSTVPGGYGERSGASTASPNMAGVMALIRSYIKSDATLSALTENNPVQINRLENQLIMSTATTVRDQAGRAYSPRKQGAGLGSLENVIEKTSAYLFTDNAESDFRPKLELGDDKERTGVYENMNFSLRNFGDKALTFNVEQLVLTETLEKDGLTVAEQAYTLSPKTVDWEITGEGVSFDKTTGEMSVQAGKIASLSVKIELSDDDKAYLEQTNKHGDKVFKNGMYVEGFLKLLSQSDGQCDLSIPFLAFYGDWKSAPMLDYSAFEISASQQDASVREEDKLKQQVWATQPYSTYYNEKYLLPMGGYVYGLGENDEKMYAKEEYCAVSRYNEYYPDDERNNYITSTGIKAVYAGLLRNARLVKYKLYDVQTGELILEDFINCVEKAYVSGGTPTPANVALDFFPEAYNLAANGQYRMDFEFFAETPAENEQAATENTFSFTFTLDYEAPVLENARVRFYDYKEGAKTKQKIYLDVDVYDNHYAQAIMLCYPKKTVNAETGVEETVLQLATEYPTPVRNPVKNGKTTMSIEITDIYEEYGNQLYLQIDDYAMNGCLYQVDIAQANAVQTPDTGFTLASGEENLTLGIYETHKVVLQNIGSANRSNYVWLSQNPAVADVKNGEIVGLKAGETIVYVSDPDKDPNKVKEIKVVVTEEQTGTLVAVPTLSFGVIKTSSEALQKATGTVCVNAGQTIPLKMQAHPWYHPLTGLSFKWSSTDESVATVDENGVVKTLKSGVAIIGANVLFNGAETRYFVSVTLRVQKEFDVSNFTLKEYNGLGYNQGSVEDGTDILVLPTDRNITHIGEDAFKDNENVRRIVIPASVVEIHESAFENCKALEEVYFVSEKHRQTQGEIDNTAIDFADLSLVHRRAFYNCKALKKVDFANVKTITLAQETFLNCENLEIVVGMANVGTAHHRAFKNCGSLQSADISRLHVSGESVFENCVSLHTVEMSAFTVIGKNMFAGCVGLRETITLSVAKVPDGAFSGCLNLKGVAFDVSNVEIGARAFENCGVGINSGFAIAFGEHTVRSIGDEAFKGAKLAVENETFTLPDGLVSIGENLFDGCQTVKTVALGNVDLDNAQLLGSAFKGLRVSVAQDSTKFAEEQGVIYALENGVKNKLIYVNTDATGENGKLDLSALPIVEIGEYAFADTKGITEIILPASLTSLGKGAFKDASAVKINFNGADISVISAHAFENTKMQSVALPASVCEIGAYAFANSLLESITTENESALVGIASVGDYAFAASALRTITFADGEQNVVFGNGVFAAAKSLTTAILPSVEEIGHSTFQDDTALKTVSFGMRSVATGDYTFAGSGIEKVVFSDGEPTEKTLTLRETQTALGEGLFYNAVSLKEIVLSLTLTEIGAYAFYGAKELAIANLENVETIGDYAFYNTALTALELTRAKTVGDYAFASGAQAKYTSVSIPVVESIGAFAFFRGAETTVVLPQSVKIIGIGAFAASKNLEAITFIGEDGETATENGVFFVDDGVLYRYIDEQKTQFAVLCYPGARVGDVPEGATKQQYKIKEGTVRVEAYSFYDLKSGALSLVVIPYSVKVIGDAAFAKSGVLEYTFECLQAPVLETGYRADIEEKIEAFAIESGLPIYKGYYYSNFQTDIYNFTKYVGKKSGMILNYPTNGKGYNSYIYRLYFGTRKATGVMMTEDTRACLELVNALVSAEEVATWLEWDANDPLKKAKVQAFSQQVKQARERYNNVLKDEAQLAILGEENGAKLIAVEETLRAVKAHFNIPVYVRTVAPAKTSAHKATYTEGEKFDWTGLVLTITYDDGSMAEITPDSGLLTLKDEGNALTPYDSYVIVEYTENGETKTAYVVITVNQRELSLLEKYPEEANVMRNVLIYGGAVMMIVGALGVLVMFSIKKKTLAKEAALAMQAQRFDWRAINWGAGYSQMAASVYQKPHEQFEKRETFIKNKSIKEGLIMKAKQQKNVQMMPTMEAVPVNVTPQVKDFVINCSKCGAALSAKSGKTAYICPVCGTLFRMRTGTRIVKEIPVKEKQIHLTLTEKAAKFIVEKDVEAKAKAAKKKKTGFWAHRRARKAKENFQRALETLIAENIRLNTYEEGDLLKIDLGDNELTVNTVKAPTEE